MDVRSGLGCTGHRIVEDPLPEQVLDEQHHLNLSRAVFLDPLCQLSRISGVSLMLTASSTGAAMGNLWAMVGGATAVLVDATRQTRVVAESPGAYRFDMRSDYNFTGLNLTSAPDVFPFPLFFNNRPLEQSQRSGILCTTTIAGQFPIEDGGGLALVKDNLGWSLCSVFVGQAIEMTCSRLSHYMAAKQLNYLVDRGLSEYFLLNQTAGSPAGGASCSKRLGNSFNGMMKKLSGLTAGVDGVGSLLLFTGLGLWVLQEGLSTTPYAGLNDLTLTAARSQSLDVSIPFVGCNQTDLPFGSTGFSGRAMGQLIFPEIFTQELNANQIIGALLLAGLGAKFISTFVAQSVTAKVIPSQVKRIVSDQVSEASIHASRAHHWLASHKENVAEKICFQLAEEGVLEGQHIAYLRNHISQRLEAGPSWARQSTVPVPPSKCFNRLCSITRIGSPMDRVISIGRMLANSTAVLPVRPVNPLSRKLLFFSDYFSKLGTVALLSAYIAQTISDGIPPVSRGFDGVPAGAASEFPFVIKTNESDSVSVDAKGAVFIPEFSLQGIGTNWFVPLITAGVLAKLIHVGSLQAFRQAQAHRVCRASDSRLANNSSQNSVQLAHENQKRSLELLSSGAITEGAFRGFAVPLTRLPCIGWLGEEPFEAKSMRYLTANVRSEPGVSLSRAKYAGLSGLYFISHLIRDILSVGAAYAIGLALIGKVFEQWTTQGNISAIDPAGAQLNLTGQFHFGSDALSDLEVLIEPDAFQGLSRNFLENLFLTWKNPDDGFIQSVECALGKSAPGCAATFSLDSGLVEEELSVYEIPNPSTITDVIWRFGLLIGMPVLAMTLWASRKMGSLGVGLAYEGN